MKRYQLQATAPTEIWLLCDLHTPEISAFDVKLGDCLSSGFQLDARFVVCTVQTVYLISDAEIDYLSLDGPSSVLKLTSDRRLIALTVARVELDRTCRL